MNVTDAPLQTNAADPEQVEIAIDAMTTTERQAFADARAEIVDYDARRRAFASLEPLFEDAPQATDDLREWVGERKVALRSLRRWSLHPELFTQMWNEGLKRQRDEAKARASRRTPPRRQP